MLCEHTEVSYYCVEWRGALFGPSCPKEEHDLQRGLIQDPDAICGSQSLPYYEGGGGYLERFADRARRDRRAEPARASRRPSATSCATTTTASATRCRPTTRARTWAAATDDARR